MKNGAILRLYRTNGGGAITSTHTIPSLTVDGATIKFASSLGSLNFKLANQVTFANAATVETHDTGGYANSLSFDNGFTGSGTLSLKRSGTTGSTRTLTIAGTNSTGSYSGNVTASGNGSSDTLDLNINTASGWGTGSLTANAWSKVTLQTSVSSATSALAVNTNAVFSLGTTTFTGASLNQGGGTINMTVGGATYGNLVLSGNADFTGGTLALTFAGSNPTGKTFDLVTYGGSLSGTPGVTFTGDIGRLSHSVANGSGSNDKVVLGFTGSVGNLTWKGNVDSNWDNNGTANFDNGGSGDVFRLFDNVTFDNSATSFTPTIATSFEAGTVAFNNTTDYTLGGAGGLTYGTSITKAGTGTVTISTTNTYTGNVTITGGTLKAGSATALGAAVVGGGTYISGGGTLDVNAQNLGAELVTIEGTGFGGNGAIVNSGAQQTQALRFVTLSDDASIGGTGRWDTRGNATATLDLAGHKLTKVGANYISIVAANVTNGDIDVNEGTLGFSSTITVNGTGTVKVNSGGNLEIGYGATAANITRDIVLNGGILSSTGSASAANSNISLAGSSSISTTGDLTLNGNLGQSVGAHTLTKTGSSNLTVSATGSTRTGETIIDNGYIFVTGDNALGSGKITIGQTTLGTSNHGLRLNGVTIDNDVDSQYTYTGDYKGAITAVGGVTSTINGTVTILPNLTGASNRGGVLASDATPGSVLRLMGELNVGGGNTGINQRDGVVEYGGGSSTSYNLTITGTARLAATNGMGSGVNVVLGGSGAATLDLNGYSTSVEAVTRNANTVSVTNNGASDATLTVSPTQDRSYDGTITNGATNSVALTKEGAFKYTLSGANTYTGATNVSGGTLSANKIAVSSSNSSLGNATSAVTLGSASAQGTLSYTGNSATYTRGLTIGGAGGGRFDVTTSGQTVTMTTAGVTGTGLFTVGGAGNTTINVALGHTGGLTKADAGTLTLSGTNTYTGTTEVAGGTLVLTSSVGGAATVKTTGTLAGYGTVYGAATIETTGILSPGNNDVDSLNFDTTLDLNPGSIYAVTIDSASTNDKVFAAGAMTANGTIKVTLSGYAPVLNDAFDLADDDDDAIAGTPSFNFDDADLDPGLAWDTSDFATNGTIKVVAAPTNTYANWAADKGLTGDDALPGADPDYDGIPNSVEMVLGGHPKTGMDTALLPTIELVTDPVTTPAIPADNYLLFTYRRTDESVAANVTANAEYDTDLVPAWTPAEDVDGEDNDTAGVQILVDNDWGDWEPEATVPTDRVRVFVPLGANTELFGRLNVFVPAP